MGKKLTWSTNYKKSSENKLNLVDQYLFLNFCDVRGPHKCIWWATCGPRAWASAGEGKGGSCPPGKFLPSPGKKYADAHARVFETLALMEGELKKLIPYCKFLVESLCSSQLCHRRDRLDRYLHSWKYIAKRVSLTLQYSNYQYHYDTIESADFFEPAYKSVFSNKETHLTLVSLIG